MTENKKNPWESITDEQIAKFIRSQAQGMSEAAKELRNRGYCVYAKVDSSHSWDLITLGFNNVDVSITREVKI